MSRHLLEDMNNSKTQGKGRDNMLRQTIKKKWSFLSQLMGLESTHRTELTNLAGQSWNIFSSCKDLPLSRFIDCIVHKNYDALIISGKPTQAALNDAWEKISNEYLELMHIDNIEAYKDYKRQILSINIRVIHLSTVLEALAYRYNDKLADILRNDDFGVELNPENPEQYAADLNRVNSMLMAEAARTKDIEAELEKVTSKNKGEKEATHEQFEEALQEIGKYQGYRIDPETTSVAAYCTYIKRLHRAAEKNKK